MSKITLSPKSLIRSKRPSAQEQLMLALPTSKPETSSYKVLQQIQNIFNRSETPHQDTHSIIDRLKKLKPEKRISDLSITNALMIENIIIDQQTKSLSKYVLKDTFDFGIKNYYSKVAESVKTRLLSKGIVANDSLELLIEKSKSALRKSQMISHYRQHNSLPKITKLSKPKTVSQVSASKPNPSLNINFRKHNCYIQAKNLANGSKQRLSNIVSAYFN